MHIIIHSNKWFGTKGSLVIVGIYYNISHKVSFVNYQLPLLQFLFDAFVTDSIKSPYNCQMHTAQIQVQIVAREKLKKMGQIQFCLWGVRIGLLLNHQFVIIYFKKFKDLFDFGERILKGLAVENLKRSCDMVIET